MSRDVKYIGLDVHKEAIVIAILNSIGHLVMESIVETKASSILQFIHVLRGELHVTLEEGTWASWLYDLLKPHVQQVLVCDPRRNPFGVPRSTPRAIGKNGCRRLSMQACAGELSCFVNSWMDCRPCGERSVPSY